MADYDNTPPDSRDLTTAATPDNTAPVAIANSQTPDNTVPTGIAVNQSPDNTAPDAVDLATPTTPSNGVPVAIANAQSPDNTAPDAVDLTTPKTPDNTAPTAVDLTTPATPNNAAAVPITDAPLSSINMPASFTPAFTELTGGGNCLDSLSATVADINKVLQGTVNGELKSYQVRAGSDATSLPGIVRPANFNAVTNAVVFVQL